MAGRDISGCRDWKAPGDEGEWKMSKRTIAVFTGNRAEFGLQYPILRAIDQHPELEYLLLVSGAHLDAEFGGTLEEIRADGFRVDAQVRIDMDGNSLFSTAQAIGYGIVSISKVLAELKPDFVVVYADRFEGFAAVVAATQLNIPTAHIEGGDRTEGGALDDSIRHAMTKLSHLHFTTNQQATNRVLAMGEESWRVHTVGFPAIDLISEGKFATTDEVLRSLDLDHKSPIVLFTQHSVSTECDRATAQISPSIAAIRSLASEGIQFILTYPNNDAGGQEIIRRLKLLADEAIPNVQVHRSLGRHLYHGVLALARTPALRVACLGNSSSGIKETPAFSCPTTNIGSRQKGRLRGENVVDVGYDSQAIIEAVRHCLFDVDFRARCNKVSNPYYLGNAGAKVAEILAHTRVDQEFFRKRMTLQGETRDGWYR